MTFVSHAQTAEDVMLWRALRDVRHGFWIDVGAADPDELSVTQAFHERGWHGVNVEPNRVLFDRLVAARPRDVNLPVALGEAPGERAFHVFGDTGLSCFDDAIAAAHRTAGFRDTAATVPVSTLAEICRRHAPETIHFLKIDVEGAEGDVLRGGDWTRDRPWIVLVEATRPLSPEPTHEAWEDVLVGAAYRFVWFDGLNRFYVAAEHHRRLEPHFRTPPNPFDDWTRAADVSVRARAAEAEGSVVAAREDARRAAVALARARADLGAVRRSLDTVEATLQAERQAWHEARGGERATVAALREALAVERDRLDHLLARPDPLERLIARGRAFDARRAREVAAARRLGWTAARIAFAAVDRLGAGRPRRLLRSGVAVLAARAAVAPSVDAARPPIAAPERREPGQREPGQRETVPPALPPSPVLGVAAAARPARPIRQVHQYHHATAVGDAVSNSLFLMRSRLRALGFASEIFAAEPHPDHAHEIRPIEEIPDHDECVLIVHHSLGDPTADRLVALRSRKILFYHNITPSSLLAFDAALAELSRAGRRQLDLWRDHAVAAIAPSAVNAAELRRRGFAHVTLFNGLIDVARTIARARRPRAPRPRDDPFTVLFVGRVLPSKGQADLVDAFAGFRRRLGDRPSRLVLVGRDFGEGDVYRALILERAAAAGIAPCVVLTGGIDDDARDAWYARADLYVSMSEHEGFGVPLVEAMAYDVPVLARRAGAVAFTLGSDACCVDGDSEAMADAMVALALDPAAREAAIVRQRRRLAALADTHDAGPLLAVLAFAGAVPPDPVPDRNAEGRALIRRETQVTLAGHVNGSYSLAGVNRAIARALQAAAPRRASLVPVEGTAGAPLFDVPDADYVLLADLASRRPVRGAPHVVISQHYPIWAPTEDALGREPDRSAAFFFWEETLIPAATVATLNERFDAVFAPSRFVARALVDSGVRVPVRLVGYAPPLADFAALATRPERGHSRPFTFLHVSSAFPRKGVDLLLDAWAEAFTPDDPVRLVLKTFPNPHNTVREDLAALRARHGDLAPVVLLDGELPHDDLLTLYLGADAMVLPSRGEGFNVPAAEAMAAGLPLVVSASGGHADFAGPDTALLIDGRHAPAATHLSEAGSLWFEPDRASLVAALRALAERGPDTAARAARARDGVLRALDPTRFGRRLREAAASLVEGHRHDGARRVAILTTWGVRCGVAEYARHLVLARPAEHRAAITILADRRTAPAEGVRPAWDLGEAFDPAGAAAAIAAADPEVLLVQHQPGLLPWRSLAALITDRRVRARVVAVTLHNTRHLWDLPVEERRPVLVALASIARVVVHRPDDLDRFAADGFENVVMIPQGSPDPVASVAAPANAVPLGAETDAAARPLRIGAYGFLLPPKGFASLLDAFRLIRDRRPAARLRLVTALYNDSSIALRDTLAARAASLGIDDAIEWHTGFLPQADSLALLAQCDAIVMPYEETAEASSAALRTVLASLRPVITTPIRVFDEAGDAVHALRDHGPEAIRDGVEAVLSDEGARAALVTRQRAWVEGRRWSVIARRTFFMLDGILAAGDAGSPLAERIAAGRADGVAPAAALEGTDDAGCTDRPA